MLLTLHFPRLRLIWSSSPHESVKILSDLKLNNPEPEELAAILKGSSAGGGPGGDTGLLPGVENPGAVEMLRAIPGVSGHNVKYVMSRVEGIAELVDMQEAQVKDVLGEESGQKAWEFMHYDVRRGPGGGIARTRAAGKSTAASVGAQVGLQGEEGVRVLEVA